MTNRFQRLGLICAAAAMAICMAGTASASDPVPSVPIVNEPIAEANVYYCKKEAFGGQIYTVCEKIGTTNPTATPTPAELAQMKAVYEAALYVMPVRARATWWDGLGMTEYCRGSTHGDCSGYCRITHTFPDGSMTIECGERASEPPLQVSFENDPTPDACSSSHGAGTCCRIEVSETFGSGTPIERIVCGAQ